MFAVFFVVVFFLCELGDFECEHVEAAGSELRSPAWRSLAAKPSSSARPKQHLLLFNTVYSDPLRAEPRRAQPSRGEPVLGRMNQSVCHHVVTKNCPSDVMLIILFFNFFFFNVSPFAAFYQSDGAV